MFKIVRNDANNALTDSEQLTDPSRISRLLIQLSKHYSPLIIMIPGHKTSYRSCIVDVQNPYVLFDELMPSSGHQNLLDTRKALVIGKLDGVDIRFETTLKKVDEQKDILTYHMKLPTKLEYRQRRQAYRVRIPASRQLRILIDNNEDTVVMGKLHDLSHGGAGKIVPSGECHIKLGECYECAIELPCKKWLYCSFEMRYLKNIPSRNRQLIGARFEGLTQIQSRLIGRCISELELEQLQNRIVD